MKIFLAKIKMVQELIPHTSHLPPNNFVVVVQRGVAEYGVIE